MVVFLIFVSFKNKLRKDHFEKLTNKMFNAPVHSTTLITNYYLGSS